MGGKHVSKQQTDLRKWTGGQTYDLLCMDDKCLSPSKYEMLTRNTSQDFGLLIHNLSESDLDCQYTCSCGFSDFTKNLSVEPIHVMSLPANETITNGKNINNGKMEIEIMLEKVNPFPHCSAVFKGQFIIETTVTVIKWYIYYNDVKVIYTFPIDDVGCEGRLQILCTLVYRNITIFDEHIDMCQGHNDRLGVRCWTNEKKTQVERINVNQMQLLTPSEKYQQEKETSAMTEV
ncbi:unnamed protein product [Mytilus edulis]|uniref:Uncharacterized protein n=1 Tax=Mytilus edulis TaxID=6550 RepID=A0A8S3QZL1_MYTED|nr:unnamed protein product [Mytilus edulis]